MERHNTTFLQDGEDDDEGWWDGENEVCNGDDDDALDYSRDCDDQSEGDDVDDDDGDDDEDVSDNDDDDRDDYEELDMLAMLPVLPVLQTDFLSSASLLRVENYYLQTICFFKCQLCYSQNLKKSA